MFENGTKLSEYVLIQKLGQGAFGEIFMAENGNGLRVAIKIEKDVKRKQALKMEAQILKKAQGNKHFAKFHKFDRCGETDFLVMELLGPNISQLRRNQLDNKFTPYICGYLGEQMIEALETLHRIGFVHRDVKPSNFVVAGIDVMDFCRIHEPQVLNSCKLYLIDFGLSRKITTRASSKPVGFRGTSKYASINSHNFKELSRPDDMWSLFYSLVEFLTGDLPWRKEKDRNQIGQLKILYHNETLVKDCPKEMNEMMKHLLKLKYNDKPDYEFLKKLMKQLQTNYNVSPMKKEDPQLPLYTGIDLEQQFPDLGDLKMDTFNDDFYGYINDPNICCIDETIHMGFNDAFIDSLFNFDAPADTDSPQQSTSFPPSNAFVIAAQSIESTDQQFPYAVYSSSTQSVTSGTPPVANSSDEYLSNDKLGMINNESITALSSPKESNLNKRRNNAVASKDGFPSPKRARTTSGTAANFQYPSQHVSQLPSKPSMLGNSGHKGGDLPGFTSPSVEAISVFS